MHDFKRDVCTWVEITQVCVEAPVRNATFVNALKPILTAFYCCGVYIELQAR